MIKKYLGVEYPKHQNERKKAISKFWRSVRCISFLSREIYPKHSQLWQIQRAPYNTNKAQQSWHIRFPNPSYRLYFTQVNKITHRRILVINTPMKILMPHCTRARKKNSTSGVKTSHKVSTERQQNFLFHRVDWLRKGHEPWLQKIAQRDLFFARTGSHPTATLPLCYTHILIVDVQEKTTG